MRYEPLEYVSSQRDWETVRENPRKKLPKVPAMFSNFDGLEFKLAMVRAPNYDPKLRIVIRSPRDVAKALLQMGFEHVESFLSLPINNQGKVIGIYVVSRGSTAHVEVVPADVLRPVLVAGAERFAIVHNHPSGSLTPSEEDKQLTRQIANASKVLGLALLDHIVLGGNENLYLSFMEELPSYLR